MTTMSVVMATFNGGRFIQRQLESIGAQTMLPVELLVADDGSTDDTVDIAERWRAEAPFLAVVDRNEQTLGVSGNFERLVARAKGDVIVLCDQDDEWVEHRLERLASEFDRDPRVMGVFSDASLIGPSSEPLSGSLWERAGFSPKRRSRWASAPFDELMRGNVVTGATLAFRASARPALLPFSTHGWHDHWIAALLAAGHALVAIDEQLVRYRLHEANQAGLPATGLARFRLPDNRGSEKRIDQGRQLDDLTVRLRRTGHAPPRALLERSEHLQYRAALPVGTVARAGCVLRRLPRRDYWRFASGWRSVAYDLMAAERSAQE